MVVQQNPLTRFRDRPVAILWGERDWCFGPSFREQWRRRFATAEVRCFAQAGHYLFEDAREEVLRELASFLDRHPLDRRSPSRGAS